MEPNGCMEGLRQYMVYLYYQLVSVAVDGEEQDLFLKSLLEGEDEGGQQTWYQFCYNTEL